MSKCRSLNPNCRIEVSRCSNRGTQIAGVVRPAAKKERVVASEPKCRFGPEIYSREEQKEKGESYWEFWRTRKVLISESDYMTLRSLVEREGMMYENCWLEVSNIPGCQIFKGANNPDYGPGRGSVDGYTPFTMPRPEEVAWSGKCVNGVVEGEGKVTTTMPGYMPWTTDSRSYKGGKLSGLVRYEHNAEDKQCMIEGRYENGLRQGEWNQSCVGSRCPEVDGTFRYVDGRLVDCLEYNERCLIPCTWAAM